MQRPLILVTNDDGIESKGLWAIAEALAPLGDILVVAPDRQWSGAGRAYTSNGTNRIIPLEREVGGQQITAYAVDGSPALAVFRAILELAPRRPALVVSGVNFGFNLGTDVTISGTVGASLEAASFGIPALAISLEMDAVHHLAGDDAADYSATMSAAQRFARRLLGDGLPPDIDVLNINIPRSATSQAPWRLTRFHRGRYFVPKEEGRSPDGPSYEPITDFSQVDPGTDVWAVKVDGVVSVTPLSVDMTARVDFDAVDSSLRGQPAS